MKDITGVCAVVLLFLMGRTGGMKPNSGFCIGHQCFALFHDPSDFPSARDTCRKEGGHLMTVRSTVSHDSLSMLLGTVAGRFWIGLHRPTGCPDAGAALRGFQWVTKDNVSDFFNWMPSLNGSCSSPRCVSVSKANDFKWTLEPCGEQAAGFLCEYGFSEPCTGLEFAQAKSVTYMTPMGFGGELLSYPPGSIAVTKPSGVKHVCESEHWLQGPWSCEIDKGGCEHKCVVNSKKVPSCSCPPGQTVNPLNKVNCEMATDDPCVALRCQHDCEQDGESHACVCDLGFILAEDNRTCNDLDECKDKRQCPGANFECNNTIGSFLCICKDGFQMLGTRCMDVDECVSAPCEHICTNSPGGYKCSCFAGSKVDPMSPSQCMLHCDKEECPAECDPNDDSQCNCPKGYISEERDEGVFCLDIDECESNYCDQGCLNTYGGYVCSCYSGYTLSGKSECVKDDSGNATAPNTTAPNTTTRPTSTTTTAAGPPTKPPMRGSGVSMGALVGIIVSTAFLIVLAVFLIYCILSHRGKKGGEAHGLEHMAMDTS
ncbi:thrombomodulin-like [Channa argus]|uniref:thrombomodulin-like n=1 Tax=Channa argus TaxID=215402 RepID=UPI002945A49E|nr:hypothetical protein Q8A73_018739 [Channa argus]